LRDTRGLTAERKTDMEFWHGRGEIEPALIEVELETIGRLPRLVADPDQLKLTDQLVRDALEATRR
jgi:hypothetical protein